MSLRLVIILASLLSAVCCYESRSAEVNKLETPYYDTLIIRDVAEILNDLESNMNPLDALVNSGSESDENIEELLSEYQQYLEKAHMQRINNHEKAKTKNKVPLFKHDRYSKTKSAGGGMMRYKDYPDPYSFGYMKTKVLQPHLYSSPLDLFGSIGSKLKYLGKTELTTLAPKDNGNNYSQFDKRLLNIQPIFPNAIYEPIKSNCFCKYNQFPCECKCEKCSMAIDSGISKQIHSSYLEQRLKSNDKVQNTDEDFINLRIKVEIQLPKSQETIKNLSRDFANSKELITYPFPYFNFPIPMNLLGHKTSSKINNHNTLQKSSAHKKKKSHGNGNKKHKKKLITFHNFNIPLQSKINVISSFYDDIINNTGNSGRVTDTVGQSTNATETNATETTAAINITGAVTTASNTETPMESTTVAGTTNNMLFNKTRTDSDKAYGTVNVTDASLALNKINSIERDFTQIDATEKKPTRIEKTALHANIQDNMRKKRQISANNITNVNDTSTVTIPKAMSNNIILAPVLNVTAKLNTSSLSSENIETKNSEIKVNKTIVNETIVKETKVIETKAHETKRNEIKSNGTKIDDTKKADKTVLADAELCYWPTNSKNVSGLGTKNITSLILDAETKRPKFNMSKESMNNNDTKALEKAIFSKVDWDDMNTVVPLFMSYVGKYLKGALTFCSQNICHSMKCEDKTCIHRQCNPNDRWNQRGHCTGSNVTDTVAPLESLMDLPPNVAFEIVDILQEKMPGKIFGKVSLCINSKCLSFAAIKKNFLKSKCSLKELQLGYCPNLKNF